MAGYPCLVGKATNPPLFHSLLPSCKYFRVSAFLCRNMPYIYPFQNLPMLKKERQAYILHQVNLHNKVLSSTLSHEINVSEDTIRRDLQELADEGKIIKVHGGALSHSLTKFIIQPIMFTHKIT